MRFYNRVAQKLLPQFLCAIFLLSLQNAAFAQKDAVVKGQVKDDNNDPIAGVTVVAKNTITNFTAGAQTDSLGVFRFYNLAAGGPYNFEISAVGFEAQTLTGYRIDDNSNISLLVKLKSIAKSLDQVLVIGYGSQSKAKVIGSVGNIGSSQLQKTAASSAELQLAGKMSGVVINQSNGQPGASAQIVIRGTGTLTAGKSPLVVVDGFPLTEGTSLNAINPNDIETIDVLKDAASAAIYGSRAANGVVLITTKKGKTNRFAVNLNIYGGMQQQSSGVKLVDAYDFAKFLSEARDWGYVSKDPANRSASDPNSVRVTKKINGKSIDGRELILPELLPYLNGNKELTNINWMNESFIKAQMYNYDIAAYGGNDKTTYYTSLGYFTQDGVVIGTNLKRYSASFNIESKLNNRLKFGVNIKPSFFNQNFGDQQNRSNGALALIPLNFPYYKVYKDDGSLNISDQLKNETRLIENTNINGTPVENLVATSLLVKNNVQRFKTFGNVYIDAELIKDLTYRLSLGGDYDSYTFDNYYPSYVGQYRIPAPRSDANGSQERETIANYLIENTLNYKKKLGDHSFNILAGYTFQKQKSNYVNIIGTKFADNNIQNVAGASAYSVTPSQNIWTLESYLARLQYDYKAKYIFSTAIRTDGSSRFGMNNRWGYFPSLSAGWVFTKEDFFPKGWILSFGKLSASWGKTGNNQIGNYGSQALVTSANYVNGAVLAPGYITTSAPNPDLGWEMASSKNIGLDLGFFKNRLNVSTAYFKTNTKNLLLDVPVPQQTGYTTVLANIGEMQNKGFEFEVSGNDLKAGAVTVGINANLTTYANKVLALGPGQTQIATGTDQNFVTKIGHSIAEIYGYNITGIYKTQQEINNTPHLDGTLTGDYIVEDMNKDGVIDVKDKVSKGTYAPEMTYGLGADVAYKGFTFSFNFMGIYGRTLLDNDMSSLTEAGEGFAVPTQYYFDHRYHPVDNPNGFLGQPNFGNFSNARKLTRSSIVVQKNNGDYLRLRDIRLAYDFPKSWLQKARLSQLQVYVSGNNAFTITKFRGWNPDATSSDILQSGYSTAGNYPVSKTFLIGIKVSY